MIGSFRPAPRRLAARVAGLAVVALTGASAGCHDLLNPPLPAGTQDPKAFNTEAGALARYNQASRDAGEWFVRAMVEGAELTDEMQADGVHRRAGVVNPVDERILGEEAQSDGLSPEEGRGTYEGLQNVRGFAAEAIGALAKYAPAQPATLRGEIYALQGFAEIHLADLYCSGVPLSTLDFERDYTYHAGSTTSEVYQHAIALFDTARTLGADSARIVSLAAIGTARALLDLGQYAEAAQSVADVPDDFRYQYLIAWGGDPAGGTLLNPPFQDLTVSDQEGVNGLDFVSSGDPRTPTHLAEVGTLVVRMPDAYTNVAPFTLASGLEARLIEAEAALDAGDASWLDQLNALRTTGDFTGVDTVVEVDTTTSGGTTQIDTTVHYDTLWVAGTGGVGKLGPLADPGTADARVDLLFRERAFWLWLTGHRQGDLRRLIRQYHRPQNQVYPTGAYPGGLGTYGSDVTVPIPAAERANPLFTGCLNRNP